MPIIIISQYTLFIKIDSLSGRDLTKENHKKDVKKFNVNATKTKYLDSLKSEKVINIKIKYIKKAMK